VLEQSKDNPVFYVQYAHARICSVFSKARDAGIVVDPAALLNVDMAELTHAAELEVARKLAEWPRLLELAARNREPHRIAFYLFEMASTFHALWNKGKDEASLRFIQEDNKSRSTSKIALIGAVQVVLCAGLGILGVTPMEEMH